jgi:hypothetical protein
MSSTKKANDWFFGMKAHIGTGSQSGVTLSLETSTAKLHDSQVWDALLHGNETSVWADKGYVSAERAAVFSGPGQFRGVMRKAPNGGNLHPLDESANRIIAKVRAKVEQPFRVIKCQFGYVKTCYRGLAKNRAQFFTLFALGNLFLVRRKLMARGRVRLETADRPQQRHKTHDQGCFWLRNPPRSAQTVIAAQPTALIGCSLGYLSLLLRFFLNAHMCSANALEVVRET